MKKRRILLSFLLVLTLVASMLIFSSCGEDPCTEHTDENSDGVCDACGKEIEAKVPENEALELIKDGKATFRIVMASGSSASERIKVDEKLVSELSRLGIEVEIIDDKADNISECEIIINGSKTRGEKYDIDPHYLGAKGYAVKLVGTKVLILAGSENKLGDAIEYFVEDVLGITSKTKNLESVTMTKEMSFEEKQTGYDITSVKVGDNDLGGYVIAVDQKNVKATEAAKSVQSMLYDKAGIWLKIVPISSEYGKAVVIKTVKEGCEEGFSIVEKDGSIIVECEFPEKLSEALVGYIRTNVTSKKGDVKLPLGLSYTKNVRVLYYKDFGAKGNGKTDDFLAIKACHDYANEHGHTVSSDPGNPTYYIGDVGPNLAQEIIIKTDVMWEGASFIFDDASVKHEYVYPKHLYKGKDVLYTDKVDNKDITEDATCERCYKLIHEDKGGCTNQYEGRHFLAVFKISSDKEEFEIRELIGASVSRGDTKILKADGTPWAPGRTMLLQLQEDTKRQYIRWGTNENNGFAQQELILVGADGTIDPSTPLHWDYSSMTKVIAKYADDEPISIRGGKGCIITTIANQGPNYYYVWGRNIKVQRSNVTVQGIKHYITGEGLPGKGKCPTAFTETTFANNVTYEDMIFTHQRNHYDASSGALLGTYEISAWHSNNITIRGCDQSNFFEPDGSIKRRGFFGSDYCKNFVVENSRLESFDAHMGVYNVTLKNSTFEHINCIGEGLIYAEDITVYHSTDKAIISLREDYGSTWNGELFLKNITVKSPESYDEQISIFKGTWTNHYFGYTCYLPEKITLDNVKIVNYTYGVSASGERYETETGTNERELYFMYNLNKYTNVDISSETEKMVGIGNDLRRCTCATKPPVKGEPRFNDTDGDGRCDNTILSEKNVGNKVICWGYEDDPDSEKNVNPYVPTKTIVIKNCGNLKFMMPPTPQFADTVITVDGVAAEAGPTGLVKKKDS